MALEGVAKQLLNREKRLFLNISNRKRLAIRNSMPVRFLARPEWAGWSIILWNESENATYYGSFWPLREVGITGSLDPLI